MQKHDLQTLDADIAKGLLLQVMGEVHQHAKENNQHYLAQTAELMAAYTQQAGAHAFLDLHKEAALRETASPHEAGKNMKEYLGRQTAGRRFLEYLGTQQRRHFLKQGASYIALFTTYAGFSGWTAIKETQMANDPNLPPAQQKEHAGEAWKQAGQSAFTGVTAGLLTAEQLRLARYVVNQTCNYMLPLIEEMHKQGTNVTSER